MKDLVFKQQHCGSYGQLRTVNAMVPDKDGDVQTTFVAVYGETTPEEIFDAYSRQQSCCVIHVGDDGRDYIYDLVVSSPTYAQFSCAYGRRLDLMMVFYRNDELYWNRTETYLLTYNFVTNTIDETAINTEAYPTAKAVYDYVKDRTEIFEAIQNVTTPEEIYEAYSAGKHCVVKLHNASANRDYIFELVQLTPTNARFAYNTGTAAEYYNVQYSSGELTWTKQAYSLLYKSNLVTSISSTSTDSVYPTAKAVYDFVMSKLGTSE